MKALVGAFNQEKAIVGAFSVIVQPVVKPMDRFAALHFLANPEQQSVTEVIDLKFVGGRCGRDRYTAGYWQPAVQSSSWELCSYPETSLMFIMFCSASSPEQLKAARHIIHRRHCGYFLLDVKQYPSHRTSSIPSWTHLHIFCTECVIFAVCSVSLWRSGGGPVAQCGARPPYPVVHSWGPQPRPTAHSWASQPHCGNPPEAALFPAKSSWLYHFHLSKQRSMQIRRS